MGIKGFWHIYMITHWYSIVEDQLRILLTSGLYDACEEISIGCLGSPAEKHLLEMYITNPYPKFKIKYYSDKPLEYEFPTLRLIEADNSEYVGFYFHAKGVSRPFETVIQHWRTFLNEAILNQWRGHYQNILNGYDASSINFKSSPDHFSGNYWWFKRSFMNKPPSVDALDHNNRWHAEQWVCMKKGKYIYSAFTEPGDTIYLIQYKK